MITYASALADTRSVCLDILGGVPRDQGTLLLLGPYEPGFWQVFQGSAEYRDGAADPMDRWSCRVISRLAQDWGGQALFPFGGPPHNPFQKWALDSNFAWQSPVGLLVHHTQGLMVSYRGAVQMPSALTLPQPPVHSPCTKCAQPCRTACPVSALSADGYQVDQCQAYLAQQPDCMRSGCAARRACPVSQTYARDPAQSAFHMRAFQK